MTVLLYSNMHLFLRWRKCIRRHTQPSGRTQCTKRSPSGKSRRRGTDLLFGCFMSCAHRLMFMNITAVESCCFCLFMCLFVFVFFSRQLNCLELRFYVHNNCSAAWWWYPFRLSKLWLVLHLHSWCKHISRRGWEQLWLIVGLSVSVEPLEEVLLF